MLCAREGEDFARAGSLFILFTRKREQSNYLCAILRDAFPNFVHPLVLEDLSDAQHVFLETLSLIVLQEKGP